MTASVSGMRKEAAAAAVEEVDGRNVKLRVVCQMQELWKRRNTSDRRKKKGTVVVNKYRRANWQGNR